MSLCLFHGIRNENEGKESWLGLQQNDSLVRPDIFCSQAEEGQAVGMVQANKLFVDAFFFFIPRKHQIILVQLNISPM